MTLKSKEIIRLKNIQKQKIEQIKKSQKRMWRHLFWLALATSFFVWYFLDKSYKVFGSSTKFVFSAFLILFLVAVGYFVWIWNLRKKNLKEIKSINNKLYRLMKLENG